MLPRCHRLKDTRSGHLNPAGRPWRREASMRLSRSAIRTHRRKQENRVEPTSRREPSSEKDKIYPGLSDPLLVNVAPIWVHEALRPCPAISRAVDLPERRRKTATHSHRVRVARGSAVELGLVSVMSVSRCSSVTCGVGGGGAGSAAGRGEETHGDAVAKPPKSGIARKATEAVGARGLARFGDAETCARDLRPPLGGRRFHPSTARGGRATRKRGDSTLVHRTHLGAYRGFADGGAVRLARFARSRGARANIGRGVGARVGAGPGGRLRLVWRRFPSPRFFFHRFFYHVPTAVRQTNLQIFTSGRPTRERDATSRRRGWRGGDVRTSNCTKPRGAHVRARVAVTTL